MQYILTASEFNEYQRLKSLYTDSKTDAVKTQDYLAGLDALWLNNYQQVVKSLAPDVQKTIAELNEKSEQQLQSIWQRQDVDFFNRKLL